MNQIDRKTVSSITEMKTFSGWINVTTNLSNVANVSQRPINGLKLPIIFVTYTATKYNQVNTPAAIIALPEVKSVWVTKWLPTERQIIISLSVEKTKTREEKTPTWIIHCGNKASTHPKGHQCPNTSKCFETGYYECKVSHDLFVVGGWSHEISEREYGDYKKRSWMTKGGTPARYYIKKDKFKYDTNAKQAQYTKSAQCIIIGEHDRRRKPQRPWLAFHRLLPASFCLLASVFDWSNWVKQWLMADELCLIL